MKYAEVQRIRLPKPDSVEELQFFTANCRTLAAIMRRLHDEQHEQRVWVLGNLNTPCGTRGCALGWAAMSGEIRGLQYSYPKGTKQGLSVYPVVNGERDSWIHAGVKFFGARACQYIFSNGELSKKGIINRLNALAALYDAKAEADAKVAAANEAWENAIYN